MSYRQNLGKLNIRLYEEKNIGKDGARDWT